MSFIIYDKDFFSAHSLGQLIGNVKSVILTAVISPHYMEYSSKGLQRSLQNLNEKMNNHLKLLLKAKISEHSEKTSPRL